MEHFKKIFGKEFVKVKLSLLWLFVMLNYIYADIMSLMDSTVLKEILTGSVDQLVITPMFLLFGALLMEIPIAMVIFSLILKKQINRWTNILAGTIKTLAVLGTLFVGTPTLYYTFFAIIEIITTISIIYIAWRWIEPKSEKS